MQINTTGDKDLEKRLASLEKRGAATEQKLSGIGSGMDASAKKGSTAIGRLEGALDDVGKKADTVSKKSVTLKASLSGNKQVEAGLDALGKRSDGLSKKSVTLKTSLSGNKQIEVGLDAIGKRSDRLDGSTVTLKTTLAGSQAVLSELSEIDGVSSKVDGDTVTITAQVKGGPEGEAQLSRLGAAASKIDGDQLTMSAEVTGAASAIGELTALDSRASSVDGRRVALDVDTSATSKLSAIGGGLQGLSSDIRSFSTVAAGVVGVPALIAGIGGLVPIAVAGGGAILQLAGAIGQGLAGAAVVGVGALGTLAGAIGLVAAPVQMLLGTLSKYQQSLKVLPGLQASAATASDAYAQAQKGVADAQGAAAQAAQDAGQAVSDAEDNLATARTDGARAIQDAERGLAEARRSGAAGVADAEQGLADARREGAASIRDAEAGLAEARRSGAESVASAEQDLARTRQEAARSIADAEQGLVDARQSAAESVAGAEDNLADARDGLESATQSLIDAEAELTDIRDGDEARSQAEAEDDLTRARLDQKQALQDYNKAVKEYGKNSDEAKYALLDLSAANRDFAAQEEETQEIRKNGSEELQNAQQGVKDAYKNQQDAARGVQDAEQNLAQTRQDAARQVADAQQALSDAQGEASQSISDASSALASARTDAARQTQAAEQALAQARSQAARDVRTAEGELASARTDAAGQSREAQRALTEAHRASAEQIATAEQGLSRARQDAARQVADAQRAVTEAQKNAASAAKAAAVAQQGVTDKTVPLTNAQKRLYDEYQRFKGLANTAFLPAQNAAANLGVQILKLAEGYLPRLGKASTATVQALSRAFSTFRTELAGPVEQAGITRYLALIPKFTEAAATGAGRLALALFNLFTRSLKYVMPLTNAFSGMASRFLTFTRSVQGGRQIDSVFADLVARAGQLWQAIKNLSAGFAGLFRNLATNGGFDRIMQGFVNLTGAFRRFTAEGSRGSQAIQNFMRSAQPALNALWGLTKTVVKEFFLLANNVAKAGQSGGKIGTLATVINAVKNSIRPLRLLFQETFTALGPVLAKLIPELAGLARTFLGSTGPLVSFLKGLQRALHFFNQLSPATKTMVANLVGAQAIFSVLGGPALLGLVASVGKTILGFKLLGAVSTKTGGFMSRIGGVLTKLKGTFARVAAGIAARGGFLGVLRIAATFLLGPWGVAIAAAIAAGVLIYKNWDKIKKAAGPLIAGFKRVWNAVKNLSGVFSGALLGNFDKAQAAFRKLPPSLRPLATTLANTALKIRDFVKNGIDHLRARVVQLRAWWVKAWPQIKQAALPVLSAVGRAIKTGAVAAFKFLQKQAAFVVNWFRKNWPLIQKTASAVFNALKKVTSAAFGVVKKVVTTEIKATAAVIKTVFGAIVKFWKANHAQITNILKAAWNIVKTTVSTAIKAVLGIIKATMQVITGDWKGAWNTIKGVVATVLKAMKSNIDSVLKIIVNILKVAWNTIKQLTSAAWEAIKNYMGDKMDAARNRVKEIVAGLSNGLKAAWEAIKSAVSSAWEAVRKTITDKIDAARNRAKEIVTGLTNGLKSAWDTIKKAASDAWTAISGAIWHPVETAYNKVTEFIDKIKGAVNAVLKLVGLPELGSGDQSSSSKPPQTGNNQKGSPALGARGGIHHPSGRVEGLRRMARGGIVPQDAVGGVVNGVMPHAVYGEAGSEAYVRLDKKTPESANALYTANEEWERRGWLPGPEESHANLIPKMARGGLLAAWEKMGVTMNAFGATRWESLWDPRTAQIARETESATGARPNTYTNHPQGYEERAPYSIDWWGSSGRGDAVGVPLGDKVLQHVTDKYASEISYWMWNAKASSAALNAAISADPHLDHVHATFMDGLDLMGTPSGTSGSGGSGISLPNPIQVAFEQGWKRLVEPLISTFIDPLKNADYVLPQAAGAAAQKVPDGIYKWIDEKIPDTIGGSGSGGSVSGNFTGSQAEVALGFAKEAMSRGIPGRLPVMTALTESGMENVKYGDLDSLGYFQQRSTWGTEAQRTDPAYALDAFLDAAGPYKGQYPNTASGLGQWAQKVQVSAYPDRYATQWDPAAQLIGDPKYYAKGGVSGESPKLEMPSPVGRAFALVANTLRSVAAKAGFGSMPVGDEGGVGSGRYPIAVTNEAGPEGITPLDKWTPGGAEAYRAATPLYGKREHRGTYGGIPAFASGGVTGGYPEGTWDLVGGDKYLGVNNQAGPMYSGHVANAMKAWGALGGVKIGPGNDVTVTTGYLDGAAGMTYSDGRIVLSPNANNPAGVARHELGHALKHPHTTAVSQMNGAGYITPYDEALHSQMWGKATGTPAPTEGRTPSANPSGSPSSGGAGKSGVSGTTISQSQTGSGPQRSSSIQTRGGGIAAGPRGGAKIQGLSGGGNVNIQMPGMGELKEEVRRLRAATEKNATIELGDKSIGKQAGVVVEGVKGYASSREFGDKLAAKIGAAARSATGTGRG